MLKQLNELDKTLGEVDNNFATKYIVPLLTHAYNAGCVAIQIDHPQFAEATAHYIFDMADFIRSHCKNVSLDNLAVKNTPFSVQASVPYPSSLSQLERFAERYLMQPKKNICISKVVQSSSRLGLYG